MSGVFKAIGTIAGIAAMIPGPHQPIAAAIAVTASIGAQLTARRPPVLGSSATLTIGADQPTPYMMGDVYCGGAVAHKTGYGPKINKVENPYLAMAMIYSAGGPIAGIDQYFADFEPLTFGGADPGPREATGYFVEILFHSTSLGALLQSTALAGPWGAIPGWGTDAKLSGKAHILWSAKWDSKNGKYQSGEPQLGIRGRGVLTWDPRADDTFPGGIGPQRWVSPSDRAGFDDARATWVYTARPGLHALRYVLGTWERDLTNPASDYVLTFGVGMMLDQVVVEDFVELENICEANSWTIGGVAYEPGDKWANLKRILEAGGAEPCWKGGRLGLKLTAPSIALDTITRDDLASDDIRAPGGLPWRDRINAVIPKFTSPEHKWELQQSPKIIVDAWVAADGEEKVREQPFQFVTAATQAAQLATYRLWDAREFGPVDIPILPRLRGYRGGDRLMLAADIVTDLGLQHGQIRVLQNMFDPAKMTGTLTVMGETAAKHAAALGQTGTAPAPIVIPTAAERDGAAASLTNDLAGAGDLAEANEVIEAQSALLVEYGDRITALESSL